MALQTTHNKQTTKKKEKRYQITKQRQVFAIFQLRFVLISLCRFHKGIFS